MDPLVVLIGSFALLIVGAIATCFTARDAKASGYLAFIVMLVSSAAVFYVAACVFMYGPFISSQPLAALPGLGAALTVRVDHMSAVFLTLVSFISLLATLYSVDYMLHYKHESVARYYPFLLIFVAGMMGVAAVSDMFFFFVFWEFMTLASYALVIYEKESEVNLKAGFKYFFLTHIGTVCMFVAAIILYRQQGSFSYTAMAAGIAQLLATNRGLVDLVLALFFIGFATKAAALPFGVWLPDAHPAAPSGVSAILSGVMIKMGIYGMLRVFVEFLPISHSTYIWGVIIACFGAISLFVGTLTALVQEDSKRLLAFHSIGQIGYVLLAIGTGLSFLPILPAVSVVALIAGLYHVVNHACFKSLLFLNAGSVIYRTGTRELNRLGGLAGLMPVTAATALVASLSIAGLPPFNAFVSKWLIFQTTIIGGIEAPLLLVFGIAAIFISGVTLASFMKFLGTSFYGKRPKFVDSLGVREVPATMVIPQVILAVMCVVLGVVPFIALSALYLALGSTGLAAYLPAYSSLFGGSLISVGLSLGEGISGAWNPIVFVVVGAITFLIVYLIYLDAGAKVRITDTWYCGEEHEPDFVKYYAHSFYLPFKRLFKLKIGEHQLEGLYPEVKLPAFKPPEVIRRAFDLDRLVYFPIVSVVMVLARRFSDVHVGVAQVYVAWMSIGMMAAIIVLLSLARAL